MNLKTTNKAQKLQFQSMNSHVREDGYLFQGPSPQDTYPSYPSLYYYIDQCRLRGKHNDLDGYQTPSSQHELQGSCQPPAGSFEINRQISSIGLNVPTVEDQPIFQEINFRLPAVQQPLLSEPDQPQGESNQGNVADQNLMEPALQQPQTILPQHELVRTRLKKTSSAKGYLILHFFKKMVSRQFLRLVKSICQVKDVKNLLKFFKRKISKRKYEYIGVKQFKEMISQNSIKAYVIRILFIRYFENYTGAEFQTAQTAAQTDYYVSCAKELREITISLNLRMLLSETTGIN